MARVTETKFAAKAVRVWRLLKRLQAKRAELTKRGIPHDRTGVSVLQGETVGPFRTKRDKKFAVAYSNTSAKLRDALVALLTY